MLSKVVTAARRGSALYRRAASGVTYKMRSLYPLCVLSDALIRVGRTGQDSPAGRTGPAREVCV